MTDTIWGIKVALYNSNKRNFTKAYTYVCKRGYPVGQAVAVESGVFLMTGRVVAAQENPPFSLPRESYKKVICAIGVDKDG